MANRSITKKIIEDKIKEMSTHKSLEDITVKDICFECGINRKTFYYYYKDKYDLINSIFYKECIEPLKHVEINSIADMFGNLAKNIEADRNFYTNAFKIPPNSFIGSAMGNDFMKYFTNVLKKILTVYFKKRNIDIHATYNEPNKNYYVDTLAGSITGNIRQWLLEHPELSACEYTNLISHSFLNPESVT